APVPRQAGAASTGTSSTEASGSDDSSSASTASAASASTPPRNQADGRQLSSSEGYDALDKCLELRVVGRLARQEPAPQRVVLAGKQSLERGALAGVGGRVAAVNIADQQLVQLLHPAPAAPA